MSTLGSRSALRLESSTTSLDSILAYGTSKMRPNMGARRASLRRTFGQQPALQAWPGSKPGGLSRPWTGFEEDARLWISDGDVLVYLCNVEQAHLSKTPRFKIFTQILIDMQCQPLLDQIEESQPSASKSGRTRSNNRIKRLQLSIPQDLIKDKTRRSVALRNFIAWLHRQPLVGEHLGEALADLLDVMRLFRSSSCDNEEDILIYTDMLGYSAIDNKPDHALAMLYFAEVSKLRHVYIDAFAHCVGMNDILAKSKGLTIVSPISKALITRAYLEMDLHVDRASKSIFSFAEDDTAPSILGLDVAACEHLDTFRSSLSSFYVSRNGYWPPSPEVGFPKAVVRSMYSDFSGLYDYLAEKTPVSGERLLEGGICVQQNLTAFNERHRFSPLPHLLPLLPNSPIEEKLSAQQWALRSLGWGKKSRAQSLQELQTGLEEASNREDPRTLACPLVRHYVDFEAHHGLKPAENLSANEARKVRWILVYCVLQNLISVLQAPPEVRETEATYPLCVLTTGTPPWEMRVSRAPDVSPEEVVSDASEYHSLENSEAESPSPQVTVQPDCATSDYFDYLKRPAEEPKKPGMLERIPSLKKFARVPTIRRRSSVREAAASGDAKLQSMQATKISSKSSKDSLPSPSTSSSEGSNTLLNALASIQAFGVSKMRSLEDLDKQARGTVEGAESKTGGTKLRRHSSMTSPNKSLLVTQKSARGPRTLRLAYRPARDEAILSPEASVSHMGDDEGEGPKILAEDVATPRTAPARDSVLLNKASLMLKNTWGVTGPLMVEPTTT